MPPSQTGSSAECLLIRARLARGAPGSGASSSCGRAYRELARHFRPHGMQMEPKCDFSQKLPARLAAGYMLSVAGRPM